MHASLHENSFLPVDHWKKQSLPHQAATLATLKIGEGKAAGDPSLTEQTWLVASADRLFILSFVNDKIVNQKVISLSQVRFLLLHQEDLLALQVVSQGSSEIIPITRPYQSIYAKLKRVTTLINLMLKVEQKPEPTPPPSHNTLIQLLEEKAAEQQVEMNEALFVSEDTHQTTDQEITHPLELSQKELEALWAPFPHHET